jgi:hypothetical protein
MTLSFLLALLRLKLSTVSQQAQKQCQRGLSLWTRAVANLLSPTKHAQLYRFVFGDGWFWATRWLRRGQFVNQQIHKPADLLCATCCRLVLFKEVSKADFGHAI